MVQGTPVGTQDVLFRYKSQRASCTPRCVLMQIVSPSLKAVPMKRQRQGMRLPSPSITP